MNDMTTDTKEENGLVVMPQPAALEVLFRTPKGLDAIIGEIEKRTRATKIDITTKKGRDECKSLAFKVAQSKNALDRAGKALNADMNAAIKVVNAERNAAWDRLEALQDEVRKPLDAWEEAEAKRIENLRLRLTDLSTSGISAEMSVATLEGIIAKISAVVIGEDWQEFEDDAIAAKATALERCNAYLGVARRREELAAENERLRAEAAERDRKEAARLEAERIERERIEAERAAEAAKVEADRLAAEAKHRAEVEAQQAEIQKLKDEAAAREKAEADRIAKVESDRLAAEKAEADAKAEAERIEAAKAQAAKEAEDRAAKERADLEARHAQELAAAQEREEAAAQAERDRLEAAQREEAAALEARKADAAHKERIHDEIVEDLAAMAGHATPSAIATAMMQGMIRHVTVTI